MDPSRPVAVFGRESQDFNHKVVAAPAELQRLPPSRASEIEDDDPRKCTYRDFSRVPPSKPLSKRRGKIPTFPMKLHMMLSTPEFSHIITWLPHGRSWRILNQADFEEQVIPLFFRHGRYSSFARQVNGWGFRRITQGDDWNSYYHEASTYTTNIAVSTSSATMIAFFSSFCVLFSSSCFFSGCHI
jgi:HSF-type DNA-binding